MSTIINIDTVYRSSPYTGDVARPADRRPAYHVLLRDTVEFSRMGCTLARAVEESSLRIAQTRAIRAEIENGTYETPERIDRTAERVLDVIG
ncbi:MAG: hypothetical protein ACYTFA_05425 [Planctomycetota bacterium]|jgi:hypothetical protein